MENILIIQDSPSINMLLTRRLKDAGFSVDAVETGEQGIERMSPGRYQLVLLDLTLPGLQGDEVCQRIKGQPETKDIPVLFISAREEEEIVQRMQASGANGYLRLPLQGKEFIDTIKGFLKPR
jgi:DNA-binding response OmpR family regulator